MATKKQQDKFNHVMVDLETMGTRAGCVILSVGAVEFDPKQGLGREFYQVLSIESCKSVGLHVEQSTMDWWAKQSPEARQVLDEAHSANAMPIQEALRQLNLWLPTGAKVWGNGADFDNSILIAAYAATGIQQGWGNWDGRCYRTLKGFFPASKITKEMRAKVGTHHHALADAKVQALHAIELAQKVPLAW